MEISLQIPANLSADLLCYCQSLNKLNEALDLRQVFGHILPKFFLGATSRMDCSTSQVARQSEKSL